MKTTSKIKIITVVVSVIVYVAVLYGWSCKMPIGIPQIIVTLIYPIGIIACVFSMLKSK